MTSGTASNDAKSEENINDIPDGPDPIDVDDDVYCIHLSFIDVQRFQTIYPKTDTTSVVFEGEQYVPQREPFVIEYYEDDVPLSKKRKATTTNDAGPFTKKCKEHTISEMKNLWGVYTEEVRESAKKHNIQSAN
ncbi:unnamed protein product [Lactuca virosa]|uniref:Uncharacterized protein n=1 Tax=Lactuca virosa TaxID=75947 RepID=A0AAU9PK74_9ASTR|nr:unnamed protein product [Lactuca virosa]